MTTGLGKGLENAMKDTDFEESELGDIHTPGEVFDWMSEKYQLMCREYLLALGWKHPSNYESPLQTESERKYYERLYYVRGYGEYKGDHYDYDLRSRVPLITIPDPPEEFQVWWLKDKGISWSSGKKESEEELLQRQEAFDTRIGGKQLK